MFVLLMIYIVGNAPAASWVTLLATLIGSFLIETVYRKRTGRHFERLPDPAGGSRTRRGAGAHGLARCGGPPTPSSTGWRIRCARSPATG